MRRTSTIRPRSQDSADDAVSGISDGELLQQLDQDDELIPQIAGTELTERLSTLTMYRFIGKYNLGEHVQQALEQLADRSALLEAARPPNRSQNRRRRMQRPQQQDVRGVAGLRAA